VNCQFTVTPFEMFRITPDQTVPDTVNIKSVKYPGVYLRMDPRSISSTNRDGRLGSVNAQWPAGNLERFQGFHIDDGSVEEPDDDSGDSDLRRQIDDLKQQLVDRNAKIQRMGADLDRIKADLKACHDAPPRTGSVVSLGRVSGGLHPPRTGPGLSPQQSVGGNAGGGRIQDDGGLQNNTDSPGSSASSTGSVGVQPVVVKPRAWKLYYSDGSINTTEIALSPTLRVDLASTVMDGPGSWIHRCVIVGGDTYTGGGLVPNDPWRGLYFRGVKLSDLGLSDQSTLSNAWGQGSVVYDRTYPRPSFPSFRF
jgi:hypothetical protein